MTIATGSPTQATRPSASKVTGERMGVKKKLMNCSGTAAKSAWV